MCHDSGRRSSSVEPGNALESPMPGIQLQAVSPGCDTAAIRKAIFRGSVGDTGRFVLCTNDTRRAQADPVRHHQFDCTFRLPELQQVTTIAATWRLPGSAEDDATAASSRGDEFRSTLSRIGVQASRRTCRDRIEIHSINYLTSAQMSPRANASRHAASVPHRCADHRLSAPYDWRRFRT